MKRIVLFGLAAVAAVVGLLVLSSRDVDSEQAAPPAATYVAEQAESQTTSPAGSVRERRRSGGLPPPVSFDSRATSPQASASFDVDSPLPLEADDADVEQLIIGSVLSDAGEPVFDAPVELTLTRGFGEAGSFRPVTRLSNDSGQFWFDQLPAGEYRLSVPSSEAFESAQVKVRSGSLDVRIFLESAQQRLRITGSVTDQAGNALAGAMVTLRSPSLYRVRAGSDGAFELEGNLESPEVQLTAELTGYEDQAESFDAAELGSSMSLDFVLVEQVGLVSVTGRIKDQRGQPVPRERILLRSAEAGSSYTGQSDAEGRFEIDGVVPADDYVISVQPSKVYQDFRQRSVVIDSTTSALDIVLQENQLGAFGGLMRNVDGEPVREFTLWLRGAKASAQPIEVTSDIDGLFFVEQVPAGKLGLQTHSQPRFSISGLRLAPNDETYVDLVLDVGPLALSGTVLDSAGLPLGGAQLVLSWLHSDGVLRSSARRQTTSDLDGRFAFSGLGRGLHRLAVQKDNERYQLDVDVSEDSVNLELGP